MRRSIYLAAALSALLAGTPALAEGEKKDDTSALPTPVEGVDDVAPLEGANSYTQDQVGAMLTENGFTEVEGLMLDGKGIWRGKAKHDGHVGDVAIDYRGNLFFDGKRIIKADEKDEEKPK
jgi:hypothetical protein